MVPHARGKNRNKTDDDRRRPTTVVFLFPLMVRYLTDNYARESCAATSRAVTSIPSLQKMFDQQKKVETILNFGGKLASKKSLIDKMIL